MDHRFTGKQEDVEVGLQYFGKRFLSAHLWRWASADPVGVHVAGEADLNSYASVRGQTLRAIDPAGLDAPTFIVKVGEKAATSPIPPIRAAGVGLLAGAAAGYLWEIDKANEEVEQTTAADYRDQTRD